MFEQMIELLRPLVMVAFNVLSVLAFILITIVCIGLLLLAIYIPIYIVWNLVNKIKNMNYVKAKYGELLPLKSEIIIALYDNKQYKWDLANNKFKIYDSKGNYQEISFYISIYEKLKLEKYLKDRRENKFTSVTQTNRKKNIEQNIEILKKLSVDLQSEQNKIEKDIETQYGIYVERLGKLKA